MNRDFVAGLLGLVLAIVYYAMASKIQVSQLADDVGPEGLPKIYAWMLGGFSTLLMVRALLQRAPAPAGTAEVKSKEATAARRGLGMLAIGVGYVVLVPTLGYPLCITLVIAIATLYQGGQMSLRTAAISALGALGLWFVFVFLLHIGQPAGIWPELIERLAR